MSSKSKKLFVGDYDELKALDSDPEENTFSDSGDEVADEGAQVELLRSIGEVTKTKLGRNGPTRSEAVRSNNEFFVKKQSGGSGRNLNKLLDSIQAKNEEATTEKVKKLVKSTSESKKAKKTLEIPAEKPVVEKAKREVLYEHVTHEVGKWDHIVKNNRVADQLVFPLLSNKKVPKKSLHDVSKDFVPKTPLEEEMAKILYGEQYVKAKQAELQKPEGPTDAESYMLSVEEALATHDEMAKFRALQSYQVAKAKRLKKIKSKKYHRLLRKDKIRKQMKEFEELQQKDPELAMQKLDELNKSRIEERMTLKHRNTSKWAKMQAARAKYDKESRLALREQLSLSRDLTKKVVVSSDDEEESTNVNELEVPTLVKSSLLDSSHFLSRWKKSNDEDKQENQSSEDEDPSQEQSQSKTNSNEVSEMINPNRFLEIKKKTKSQKIYDAEDKGDSASDAELDEDYGEEDEQRNLISEAFEDDDVVAEFEKKKADEVEASKPKDIDLSLPGWGEWGGKGIKPSKKKSKFIIKAKPAPRRKDSGLPHVIYNEKVSSKVKEHQVRQLPFPFAAVEDFEKHVKAPIGRTWMPETAMKKFIAPKVVTRLGSVIKPLTDEVVIAIKEDEKAKARQNSKRQLLESRGKGGGKKRRKLNKPKPKDLASKSS